MLDGIELKNTVASMLSLAELELALVDGKDELSSTLVNGRSVVDEESSSDSLVALELCSLVIEEARKPSEVSIEELEISSELLLDVDTDSDMSLAGVEYPTPDDESRLVSDDVEDWIIGKDS